ncbi:unnamed protein product, partial [Brenthis ino]
MFSFKNSNKPDRYHVVKPTMKRLEPNKQTKANNKNSCVTTVSSASPPPPPPAPPPRRPAAPPPRRAAPRH